jgi:ADP-ribose pyrophosphatase YjhB (NUDIX family)
MENLMPVARPAARVLCLAEGTVLLLRWRDPVEGFEVWEPPGGGLETGETWRQAAERELREEAGLVAAALAGPVLAARDYRWAGRRIAGDDAFFLARWRSRPDVVPEADPALLGWRWVPEDALGAVPGLEPPGLAEVLSSLRSARPSPPSR